MNLQSSKEHWNFAGCIGMCLTLRVHSCSCRFSLVLKEIPQRIVYKTMETAITLGDCDPGRSGVLEGVIE